MMHVKRLRFVLFFAAVLCSGLVAAWLPGTAHPSIDIVASNWKFAPSSITVQPGETVTLRLTSSEGVHGLKSDELGIPDTVIMPNKFVTVSFTPTKPGTYTIHCSVICGAGHPNMVLTIKVQK